LDQSRIGGHPENKYMQVPLSIEKARTLLYNKTAQKLPQIDNMIKYECLSSKVDSI
jgi:hypothetical protein